MPIPRTNPEMTRPPVVTSIIATSSATLRGFPRSGSPLPTIAIVIRLRLFDERRVAAVEQDRELRIGNRLGVALAVGHGDDSVPRAPDHECRSRDPAQPSLELRVAHEGAPGDLGESCLVLVVLDEHI